MTGETLRGTVRGTVPETVSVQNHATPALSPTPPLPSSPITSSRTDAQRRGRADEESITSRIRRITEADALTRLVCAIRPEWSIDDVHAWALRDERPTADVIAAGINGARDRSIRQVGGLQFAGPAAATPVVTYPTVAEALDPQLCRHEFRAGACPLCRRGAP